MKKQLSIAMGLALAGLSSVASAEFSGNVALTTDYVWRGVSQTDEGPAVQGGFDYEHASGFSAGVWGSNVDFGGESLELDYYAGYGTELDNGLGLSVGVIAYTYHNEGDADFEEGNLGLSYGPFSAMVSHDFDNDNTYYEAALEYEVGEGFMLGAHIGDYDFDDGGDYTDWSLSVSKSYAGFDFSLGYTDTDISSSNDPDDLADGRAVFTIAKSL